MQYIVTLALQREAYVRIGVCLQHRKADLWGGGEVGGDPQFVFTPAASMRLPFFSLSSTASVLLAVSLLVREAASAPDQSLKRRIGKDHSPLPFKLNTD
ncbi:MAG: hypothetical protein ACK56F_30315 [bacterium]